MHFIGSAPLESLSLWEQRRRPPPAALPSQALTRQLSQRESLLPSYYASPSPDRLGGINLRPAGAEGVGGGFGFGFGAEHAEDRRAAAGHEGGDGSVLPEGGLDGLVVLSPAALRQRRRQRPGRPPGWRLPERRSRGGRCCRLCRKPRKPPASRCRSRASPP